MRVADVLEHADRGDLVVRLGLGQFAVVAQLHRHPAAQAALVDQAVARARAGCFDNVMPCARTP